MQVLRQLPSFPILPRSQLRHLRRLSRQPRQPQLRAQRHERGPFEPREDVTEERGVGLGFDDLELDVPGVERECVGGGFTGAAGAGEEVEGEEFHRGRWWVADPGTAMTGRGKIKRTRNVRGSERALWR